MTAEPGSDTTYGILSLSIAECFGTESVSSELASSLAKILPEATFLRATIRCGSGLFVTDDLLRQGYSMVSLVSLKYSLAGLAMKQGLPLTVRLPPTSSFGSIKPSRIVACVPVAVPPPPGTSYRPLQVGAFLLGSSEDSLTAELKIGLARLAAAAGPALLTVGLGRLQHLSDLLSLRDADAQYIGAEEDLQDLPLEVARPHSSMYGPPTQPLDLDMNGLLSTSNGGGEDAAAQANGDAALVQSAFAAEKMPSANGPTTNEQPSTAIATAEHPESNPLDEPQANNRFFLEQAASSSSESLAHLAPPTPNSPTSQSSWGAGKKNKDSSGDRSPASAGEEELQQRDTEVIATKGANGLHTQAMEDTSQFSLGPLLCFQNCPALESAFIAAEAHVNANADVIFCAMYLGALMCLVWSQGAGVHAHAWIALMLAAVLPMTAASAAVAGAQAMYARCREVLLMMLLLVTVVVAHRCSPFEAMNQCSDNNSTSTDSGSSTTTLGCILRPGDLVLAIALPLGCRIRFCWLLPGQAVNLWSIARVMPWSEMLSNNTASSCAAVLAIAGILPLIMVYVYESGARKRLVPHCS